MGLFTDKFMFDFFAIVTTVIVVVITYMKWKLKHWDRVGLQSLNPSIFFGDSKDLILARSTFGEQFQDFYKRIKEKGLKHGGAYFGLSPWYIPIDTEIIKHIMQTDFQHFVDHVNYINEEADPLSGHLFALQGTKWRHMRVKLSPTFTSGKMKMMFQTIVDCSYGLNDIMDSAAKKNNSVDIKDILGRFTTDVIGSVAFGLECNSLKDPNSMFRKYGKRTFEDTAWERFRNVMTFVLPHSFLRAIKFKVTKSDVEEFMMNTLQKTVEYREKNNIARKDFMHLLLQLKNRGTITDDEKIKDENNKTGEVALNMNELMAQAFLFFAAGFETSSTTMTFALLELAMNPTIQEKLRKEIRTILAQHDNQLTYDSVMEMPYLDKVINETLRKYPAAPVTNRECTKDYIIPQTQIKLKKGTNVGISILGLHYDPQYYPKPEIFDPERFSEENKKSRPPFTWLPFGEGPRICIGLRFGVLQSKIGIIALLRNYQLGLSKKTKLPITLDKNSFITSVEGGVWLDVQELS